MARGRGRGRGRGAGVITGRVLRNSVPQNHADHAADAQSLCGMCTNQSSPVQDDGIGCDRCDKWFHPTPQCTGLASQVIQSIQSSGGDGVLFICIGCRSGPVSPPQGQVQQAPVDGNMSVQQIYQVVSSLASTVASLTTQVQQLTSTVAALAARPTQSQGSFNANTRESL